MAVPKSVSVQNDFSAGELDPSAKRGDSDKTLRAGLRQCANMRILNTKKIANRFGRTAKFIDGPRCDEVLMSPGNVFFLCFSAGKLTVRSYSTGASVFTSTLLGDGATAIPWTALTVSNIRWAVYQLQVFITFPGIVPQILAWDGVSTWSLATYTPMTIGTQKRTVFYRLAPQGITLQPSATTGVVNITFVGGNVLVAGMVGTLIRYCGCQMQIKTVSSATAGTATVIQALPPAQSLTVSSQVGGFNVGDEVKGVSTGATGIVVSNSNQQIIYFSEFVFTTVVVGQTVTGLTSGATGTVVGVAYYNNLPADGASGIVVQVASGTFAASEAVSNGIQAPANIGVTGASLVVQLLQTAGSVIAFGAETIVGPSGQAAISAVSTASPQPVTNWDQEIMNSYQGWPSSVSVDQNRLILCNFPALPNMIVWSAIGLPSDLYTDAANAGPDNAINELAPDKAQVLAVMAGPESSEFVFCDKAIWYIPINATNPLKPGSVGFSLLSGEGCSTVQPCRAQESIVYIPAGGTSMRAIVTTGAYYRPHEVRRVSTAHDHLFKSPVAIAAPGAIDPNFPELYVYVVNGDGTLAVAKIMIENGQITEEPGWVPWSGVGTVNWVSSRPGAADVLFTTTYPAPTPVTLAEMLDATQYLDAALPVNNVPAALTPPGGKGPLWWYASGSVFLIDQSTRIMGVYQVDANGNIIPQNNDGENLALASLVAGQQWTATAERFVPGVNEGPEGQGGPQRMRKRRIARNAVYVQSSSGFLMQSLRGGVAQAQRRIPTWNQGEDPTKPPPLREMAYEFRFKGRDHDPRQAIIKDTPGSITVLENTHEVTF